MMKPWCLMCCNCRRLLSESGEPVDWIGTSGTINVSAAAFAAAKAFETKEQADEFAQQHGWLAEDGNHRCPQCSMQRAIQATEARWGAYIDLREYE
jgi:hypothetical protein